MLTGYGEWPGRPFERAHRAGAEFFPYRKGYMDGAVRSGQNAAAELLSLR
ncbi:hypothetical protein [Streptomyces sp. NPDC005476]